MAKGLHPHHHSNSPITWLPRSWPPVQFPGQCHRGFQTHILRSTGPCASGKGGKGGAARPLALPHVPRAPTGLSLTVLVGPAKTEVHRPGASARVPCTPTHTHSHPGWGKALGTVQGAGSLELTLLLAWGSLSHPEPEDDCASVFARAEIS